MQAPKTQYEALKQLIDLITKLELELKCTISYQIFVKLVVTCEGITFDCQSII